MRSLLLRALVPSLVVVAACSSQASPSAAPASGPDDAGAVVDASASADASVPPSACEASTAKLKAALDGAHGAKTDAVVAVKDEACGVRVVTSGPSHLEASKLHRIGSVTKTYVAAVVLSLAHDGALGLEDPVSKWVSAVPNGDAITLHHLLQHTSGLFNYTDDPTFLKEPSKTWTPREIVDLATKSAPYFEPGKGFHYSNTNYILLGMVAEAAGKASIGALVRQRVLGPIGAAATFFDGEEPVGGALAVGRDASGRDVTHALDPSAAWAAGAIVATPADVAAWIERVGAGTFYDAPTEKALLTTVPMDQKTVGYGLGIMVFDPSITGGAGPAIGHGGDIPGYHTQAFYFPNEKTTLVSIVDSDAESPNDVSVAAMGVLFGGAK